MIEGSDLLFLRRCVELAKKGLYSVTENPRVGCLLVSGDDVLGRGWHRRRGELHAEAAALANARDSGRNPANATAYVSLEPCCHTGRQPPCTAALIDAGIKRVVGAMTDPDPRVAGEGYATLRAAGIAVETVELAEAIRMNRGFVRRITTGLPFVRIKIGASIDGRTAMASGQSQWITGPDARADVQRYRAQSCAIVTGRGTVALDDPALTVRGEQFAVDGIIRQPLRVVADTYGTTPPEARLFATDSPVYLATGRDAPDHPQAQMLRQEASRVEPGHLLRALAEMGCNEVLVEAGATLAGAILEANLWDEAVLYLAPNWLGDTARPMAAVSFDHLADSIGGKLVAAEPLGTDVKVVLANASHTGHAKGTRG